MLGQKTNKKQFDNARTKNNKKKQPKDSCLTTFLNTTNEQRNL